MIFPVLSALLFCVALLVLFAPTLSSLVRRLPGLYLRKKTAVRLQHILETSEADQALSDAEPKHRRNSEEEWESVESYAVGTAENGDKADAEWAGVVGFFHPFCNAGGGGERVLWAAIRATQNRWPKATCVVYTGDNEADKKDIIERVKYRFSIDLQPPRLHFLYLTTRHYVLASTWPHFTLLGQSIGSLILAWDALSLLVPHIFVDTMGYGFALGFCKLLLPEVATGAYVHYPTISTDMLGSLDASSPTGSHGVNAGQGSGTRGAVKKLYWELFAKAYSYVGATIDVVMTNSSWTQAHIAALWGPLRAKWGQLSEIQVVYPPVAVEEVEEAVAVSEESEKKREKILLYIAQFRPEKNHRLIMEAFAKFMATMSNATKGAKLVFIGSVRDDADRTRVYEYRLLVRELLISDSVEFHLDASWPEILDWLQRSSVGVNGMWNEHFGIGVVEYQAAGLISVVHDSGGPRSDIVTEIDGSPTGFHATTAEEFAIGFEKALSLDDNLAMRRRARKSAERFTEAVFARKWVAQMEKLVELTPKNSGRD